MAAEALERIGRLYEIERAIRGRPPDERRTARLDALDAAHALRRRWPPRDRQQRRGRALRTIALGRKNYLFCGSDAGGERAAAIFGSAKLNGIEAEAYLRYVLERVVDYPINRVGELLRWAVADVLKQELPLAA